MDIRAMMDVFVEDYAADYTPEVKMIFTRDKSPRGKHHAMCRNGLASPPSEQRTLYPTRSRESAFPACLPCRMRSRWKQTAATREKRCAC